MALRAVGTDGYRWAEGTNRQYGAKQHGICRMWVA